MLAIYGKYNSQKPVNLQPFLKILKYPDFSLIFSSFFKISLTENEIPRLVLDLENHFSLTVATLGQRIFSMQFDELLLVLASSWLLLEIFLDMSFGIFCNLPFIKDTES